MRDEEILKYLPKDTAPGANGIGTLSEKSVHGFLKNLYMPDHDKQEVRVGQFIADIFDGYSVTEIQTGHFAVLRRKLDYYLPRFPVCVVCPVVCETCIVWTDPETGAASPPRKSPRHANASEALHELWQIRDYLCHPNLTIDVVLVRAEEYRVRNGRGKSRSKGTIKIDRVPTELLEILRFRSAEDYRMFLPPDLPECFSVSDFRLSSKLRPRQAYSAVHVLETIGLIEEAEAPERKAKKGKTPKQYRVRV